MTFVWTSRFLQPAPDHDTECEACRRTFLRSVPKQRFCSGTCRVRAFRSGQRAAAEETIAAVNERVKS